VSLNWKKRGPLILSELAAIAKLGMGVGILFAISTNNQQFMQVMVAIGVSMLLFASVVNKKKDGQ
jgi:hypothetical protein